MRLFTTLLTAGVCVLVLGNVAVLAKDAGGAAETGERLVRELWADFAEADLAALGARMPEGFQSVHESGASDRAGELEILKGLKLGDYALADFRITQEGDTLIATYSVTVSETINGQRLDKAPAPRLSIFRKTGDTWQWIAHANLHPMAAKQ